MKKIAVIVAGGAGTRMGAEVPKQFILLNGKPLFVYTIETFLSAYDDLLIILVMNKSFIDEANSILIKFGLPLNRIQLTAGGETRYHSVQNGLNLIDDNSVVFVHDAVRCLISDTLIQNCYEECLLNGSAIPVISVRDSIRRVNSDGTSQMVNRNDLVIVQTPQTFYANELKEAFSQEYQDSFTDEASVFENIGRSINLIVGEESNIKITFPDDLNFAAWKISQKG